MSGERPLRARAVLEQQRHLHVGRRATTCSRSGCRSPRPAAPPTSPSASAHRVPVVVGARRVVRLVPAAAGPPHRALDDDRHAVGRPDRRRDRRVGQARVLVVHPDVEAAVGRDRVRLHDASCRPAAGTSPRTCASARAGVRDQHEQVEEAAPSPPRRGTTPCAGAVTPALSCPAPKVWPGTSEYIARSTMIGWPLMHLDHRRHVGARQRAARARGTPRGSPRCSCASSAAACTSSPAARRSAAGSARAPARSGRFGFCSR